MAGSRFQLARVLAGVHVGALLTAAALMAVAWYVAPATKEAMGSQVDLHTASVGFAAAGALAGLAAMAMRPPKRESIALAISTLAAFLWVLSAPAVYM